MDKKNSGRIWPYAIGMAITLVFSFCVMTIIVTAKADLQLSDNYMMKYQDADANANEFIKAKIDFDKKYKVSYVNNGLNQDGTDLTFKITDLQGNSVSNVKLILAISRPETHDFDKKLENFVQKDSIYSFKNLKLGKAGKWNFITKIIIGDNYRFLNIKADTRNKKYSEF